MSVTRREEVAKVCRDHNLLILEDDAYAVLMDDRLPPSVASHQKERL